MQQRVCGALVSPPTHTFCVQTNVYDAIVSMSKQGRASTVVVDGMWACLPRPRLLMLTHMSAEPWPQRPDPSVR
jgi:hypothetical protein